VAVASPPIFLSEFKREILSVADLKSLTLRLPPTSCRQSRKVYSMMKKRHDDGGASNSKKSTHQSTAPVVVLSVLFALICSCRHPL
jgi:hypothetical protein